MPRCARPLRARASLIQCAFSREIRQFFTSSRSELSRERSSVSAPAGGAARHAVTRCTGRRRGDVFPRSRQGPAVLGRPVSIARSARSAERFRGGDRRSAPVGARPRAEPAPDGAERCVAKRAQRVLPRIVHGRATVSCALPVVGLPRSPLPFLWASGARSDRRERRRQGSSPEGRRPRSGLRGAGRGAARPGGIEPGARPQAGLSPTPRRTNPLLGMGPTPKTPTPMSISQDRKGDDGIRERNLPRPGRPASERRRARAKARHRRAGAEGGPAAASAASGVSVSVAVAARKEPPVAEATSGSLLARGRGEMSGYDRMASSSCPKGEAVTGASVVVETRLRDDQLKRGCVSRASLTVVSIAVPEGTRWAPRGSSVI